MQEFRSSFHLIPKGWTMDCNQAMDLITGYLFGKEVDKDKLSLIYGHIAGCGACQCELEATLGILWGERFDLVEEAKRWQGCDLYHERLAEFAEMNEAEAQRRAPEFLAHLNTCPACREDCRFLRELAQNERNGAFGAVPSGPTFGDVAREVLAKPSPIWEEGGQDIRRLATELKLVVERGLTWLAEVPQWLRPWQSTLVPVYARPTRGKEGLTEPGTLPGEQELALPDEEKNLKILLRIRGGLQNRVDIIVVIYEFSTGSTMSGVEVTLCDQQKNILEHSVTVPELNGTAMFKNLELAKYYLRIEAQQTIWEVPLVLSPSEKEKE